jgi:hypothetical protein
MGAHPWRGTNCHDRLQADCHGNHFALSFVVFFIVHSQQLLWILVPQIAAHAMRAACSLDTRLWHHLMCHCVDEDIKYFCSLYADLNHLVLIIYCLMNQSIYLSRFLTFTTCHGGVRYTGWGALWFFNNCQNCYFHFVTQSIKLVLVPETWISNQKQENFKIWIIP